MKKLTIPITPKTFEGQDHWEPKQEGVVLVETPSQIDAMYQLLVEQDDYWESYKHVIKVAPKQIDSISDINKMCEYCGKTDIYDIEKLRSKISFLLFQQ